MNKKMFVDYVMSFYGIRGIYPIIGLRKKDVLDAMKILTFREWDFCGDSFDREKVRDVLIDELGFEFPVSGNSGC